MCRQARCPSCGKTTWSGCGNHIEQVMASVPDAQRCTCDGRATKPTATSLGRRLRALLRRT